MSLLFRLLYAVCYHDQKLDWSAGRHRLKSLGRGDFKGGDMLEGIYHVQHAMVSQISVLNTISMLAPVL